MPDSDAKTANRYHALLERIFLERYSAGMTEVAFARDDMAAAAKKLRIALPKNLGDVVYSARYRAQLPRKIVATQPPGSAWAIEGAGRARYAFRLSRIVRIAPNPNLATVKIPDATPEIVGAYALSDEQALLAKLRYNRLIDVFLGIAAYSLQSHLRTTVAGIGQIEIDEVYVGVDRDGRHYIVPVQAKGGGDKLNVVQTKQDIAWAAEKFPGLVCRALSAQFVEADRIALFELKLEGDSVKIADEAHYRLVPAEQITPAELADYRLCKR